MLKYCVDGFWDEFDNATTRDGIDLENLKEGVTRRYEVTKSSGR